MCFICGMKNLKFIYKSQPGDSEYDYQGMIEKIQKDVRTREENRKKEILDRYRTSVSEITKLIKIEK